MTTSPGARIELYNELSRVIGPDNADTLMSYLNTEIPGNLATKADVDGLRSEMRDFRAELRTEMADFKAEMRAEMADFKAEIREEMRAFRTDINGTIAALEKRLDRILIAVMSAVAVIAAALTGSILTLVSGQ